MIEGSGPLTLNEPNQKVEYSTFTLYVLIRGKYLPGVEFKTHMHNLIYLHNIYIIYFLCKYLLGANALKDHSYPCCISDVYETCSSILNKGIKETLFLAHVNWKSYLLIFRPSKVFYPNRWLKILFSNKRIYYLRK